MVLLRDFDVFDDAQLKKAVSRSNVVINLLGMDKETMNFRFEDIHIEAAKKVATAAAGSGLLERYLHVSALAASPDHTSRKLRTKVSFCIHNHMTDLENEGIVPRDCLKNIAETKCWGLSLQSLPLTGIYTTIHSPPPPPQSQENAPGSE